MPLRSYLLKCMGFVYEYAAGLSIVASFIDCCSRWRCCCCCCCHHRRRFIAVLLLSFQHCFLFMQIIVEKIKKKIMVIIQACLWLLLSAHDATKTHIILILCNCECLLPTWYCWMQRKWSVIFRYIEWFFYCISGFIVQGFCFDCEKKIIFLFLKCSCISHEFMLNENLLTNARI